MTPNLPKNFVRKILAKDPETGFFVELQDIAPGSFFSEHRHASEEWVYVLQGEFEDEFGKYLGGTFKINQKNSIHTPKSLPGCKLLVFRKEDYVSTTE